MCENTGEFEDRSNSTELSSKEKAHRPTRQEFVVRIKNAQKDKTNTRTNVVSPFDTYLPRDVHSYNQNAVSEEKGSIGGTLQGAK